MTTKREFGDWQTPLDLADAAIERLAASNLAPASIVEPTCGEGAFLVAAAKAFPAAKLVGYEVNPAYVEIARLALGDRGRVVVSDFFATDWEHELARLPEPLLLVGNPPWFTNAGLGVLASNNLPEKRNFKRHSGLDAMTGKSNFDVSEWMILRLIEALVRGGPCAPWRTPRAGWNSGRRGGPRPCSRSPSPDPLSSTFVGSCRSTSVGVPSSRAQRADRSGVDDNGALGLG